MIQNLRDLSARHVELMKTQPATRRKGVEPMASPTNSLGQILGQEAAVDL